MAHDISDFDGRGVFEGMIEAGASAQDVIKCMKERGMIITDAIKAIRVLYSVQLGEAKRMVSGHPSWQAIVEANQPLHQAIDGVLREHKRDEE